MAACFKVRRLCRNRPPEAKTRASPARARACLRGRRKPLDGEGYRLAALGGVDDPHVDLLAFREMRNSGRPKDRDVDEDVLAAVVAGDEAESLGVVEPLHLAGDGRSEEHTSELQ